MKRKPKARVAPDLEPERLTESFEDQRPSGRVNDALLSGVTLPSLRMPHGEAVEVHRGVWSRVAVADGKAPRVHLCDMRLEACVLSNVDWTETKLERVEIRSTALTGANLTEGRLRDVLFQDCKIDFSTFRMTSFERCVFERCNLVEADFYAADLGHALFRECDLSRADLSSARLSGADLRGCRLDGMRGRPAEMEGLIVSPDQAAQLIPLFGVSVQW